MRWLAFFQSVVPFFLIPFIVESSKTKPAPHIHIFCFGSSELEGAVFLQSLHNDEVCEFLLNAGEVLNLKWRIFWKYKL